MANLPISTVSSANTWKEAVSSNEMEHNRIFNEHALLNNLIVQHIFKFLETSADLKTLKNIRLVCTVWLNESLFWWRKTAIFNLNPHRALKESKSSCLIFKATCGNSLCVIQQPLASELYRINDKPFYKYKLENSTVDIENGNASRSWLFWGPQVKHVVLRNVTFFTEQQLYTKEAKEDFTHFLQRHMPNLEELVLDNICIFNTDYAYHLEIRTRAPMQYPLTNVLYLKLKSPLVVNLRSFPNLEHLVLEDCEISFLYFLLYVMLHRRRRVLPVTKIKRVDITLSPEKWNVIGFYSKDQFKLEHLQHFTVQMLKTRPRPRDICLYSFLHTHRHNLEVLEMFDFPFLQPYPGIPCNYLFTKLRELRLWGSIVKNLEFLKFTPNLKVLHMDLFGLERQEELRKEIVRWTDKANKFCGVDVAELTNCNLSPAVLPKLEYLQINCLFSWQQLRKLGEWMPNLKTLKTLLGRRTISIISTQWPFLEELVGLQGSKIQDEDIMTFTGPCLRDLQNLKMFHLKACCDEGLLTDLAAEFGFLQMERLKDLRVCVSSQFSEEMEKQLNERIPFVHIIRNYTGNQEHVNWKCCRDLEFVHYFRDNFTHVVWG